MAQTMLLISSASAYFKREPLLQIQIQKIKPVSSSRLLFSLLPPTLLSSSSSSSVTTPLAIFKSINKQGKPKAQFEDSRLDRCGGPVAMLGFAIALLIFWFPLGNNLGEARALDVQRGATLFKRACIGCHDAGGNIIQPGSTLFPQDLQRNGMDSEENIYRITYFGKGRMPGFGEQCMPKGQCTFGPRLSEEDIRALAQFVKFQAQQGWPKIEYDEDR